MSSNFLADENNKKHRNNLDSKTKDKERTEENQDSNRSEQEDEESKSHSTVPAEE